MGKICARLSLLLIFYNNYNNTHPPLIYISIYLKVS